MLAEYKWVTIINPSYNIQAIIDPFKGTNHYRYGKILSNDIKLKISNTLKNRIVSEEKIKNHIIGAKKKKVYCYHAITKEFVTSFDGIRIMQRELNLSYIAIIQRKLDTNKPFILDKKYLNKEINWILTSKPLKSTKCSIN